MNELANVHLVTDVAIIVPYRDRKIQLKIFLRYMESFLFKQGNNIRIYIIEQVCGAILYLIACVSI